MMVNNATKLIELSPLTSTKNDVGNPGTKKVWRGLTG